MSTTVYRQRLPRSPKTHAHTLTHLCVYTHKQALTHLCVHTHSHNSTHFPPKAFWGYGCSPVHLPAFSSTPNKRKKKTIFIIPIALTPFLPGMAHSQTIRFSVPSMFLIGLATKPYDVDDHHHGGGAGEQRNREWEDTQKVVKQKNVEGSAAFSNHKAANWGFVEWNGMEKKLTKGWSLRQVFRSSPRRAIAMPDISDVTTAESLWGGWVKDARALCRIWDGRWNELSSLRFARRRKKTQETRTENQTRTAHKERNHKTNSSKFLECFVERNKSCHV